MDLVEVQKRARNDALLQAVKAGIAKSVTLVPLADGRVLLTKGTNGCFDPEKDVFPDAERATDAARNALSAQGD